MKTPLVKLYRDNLPEDVNEQNKYHLKNFMNLFNYAEARSTAINNMGSLSLLKQRDIGVDRKTHKLYNKAIKGIIKEPVYDCIEEYIDYLCETCGELMLFDEETSEKKCPCGRSELETVFKINYDDGKYVHTKFIYSRDMHFASWLSLLSGNEEVPDHVYTICSGKVGNTKIKYETLYNRLKNILKTHDLAKYYSIVPSIIRRLTGEYIHISDSQMIEMCAMHRLLQPVFEQYKINRSNAFSTAYVVYKLARILGYQHIYTHPAVGLLKDRVKIHSHECVWKNICNDLGWEYQKN